MRCPANTWRYVAAALIILVTAGTSAQLYRGERRREQQRLESSFRVLAGDRVHNFLHQLESNLEILQVLEAWLISEMETGGYELESLNAQFLSLARRVSLRNRDIFVLGWIPRIGDRTRVAWMDPPEMAREYQGSDLLADPRFGALIEAARDGGSMTASGRILCPEEGKRNFDVWLFDPIYSTAEPPEGVAERRSGFIGVMVMVLDVADMIELAGRELPPADISLMLFDENAPPAEHVLYQPEAHGGAKDEGGTWAGAPEPEVQALELRSTVAVALNRSWTVVARPGAGLVAGHVSAMPSWSLAGGLLLSLVVGGGLFHFIGRAARIEHLVEERTLQLSREVAERKEAHARLHESEERYRTLAENAQDIIYVLGLDDRIQYVNSFAARAVGVPAAEVVGQPIERFAPDISEQEMASIRQTLASGRSVHQEFRALVGGRAIWQDVNIAPLKNAAGEHYANLGIARDITARRQIEDELKQAKEAAEAATRAKSDFLATMSHEIRTPLNGVVGAIGLLQADHLGGRQRELVRIARASAGILVALIDDILDFSKIEAGRVLIEPLPFDRPREASASERREPSPASRSSR